MNLVMPSTLYLQSCTITFGLDTETMSISPLANSDWKIGRFLMHTLILSWSAGMCYSGQEKGVEITAKIWRDFQRSHSSKVAVKMLTYWLHVLYIINLLLDHSLEVNVYFDSQCLIIGFSLAAFLFDVVHTTTSFLTINLEFLNFVQARGLFGEIAT